MIGLTVPGWKSLQLAHLVLDVNGTLALDGSLLPGVAERTAALREVLEVHLLSADTFGQLDGIAHTLGVAALGLEVGQPEPQQKLDVVRCLNAATVVAIGNGANDVAMLREAALGIAVLGPEGLCTEALAAADVIVGSIDHALDLLRYPKRLIATLRR